MESFKIEHFQKENPNEQFPYHRHLSDSEESALREKLFEKFGLNAASSPMDMFDAIDLIARDVGDANPDDFSLLEIIKTQEIECEENVFVSWYRFDDIDEFHLKELSKYFDDIWYPSSDDIEIFDRTCSWLISVRHDGAVFLSIPH